MRLSISLTREEFDHLVERARAERRRPRDQAAYLLATALGTGSPATERTEQMPATLPAERASRDAALAEAAAR